VVLGGGEVSVVSRGTGRKERVMKKVVAINGNPRMEKGNTEMLLSGFIEGMKDAGSEVEEYYASRLKVKSCTCGGMYCWYKKPGECCTKDDMELLYPKLREAEILVFAISVYVPFPGDMQNIMNRLCALVKPVLEWRDGRTGARFHDDVRIEKMVLVSTCGWWEQGNFGTLLRIVEEFAKVVSVEFTGAVLRAHSDLMKEGEALTEDGEAVLEAARKAGFELVKDGVMSKQTLEAVSRPLIEEEQLRRILNGMLKQAG